MYVFLLLLMAILGGIIGYPVSALFFDTTRFWANWAHVLAVTIPSIAGFMVVLKLIQPRLSGKIAEALSEPGNNIGAFAMGVVLTSIFYKSDATVQFYMDNGTRQSVSLSIKETNNTYTVKPKEVQKVVLPCGKITFNMNGKDTVIDFPNHKGYWIMNPNNANEYIERKMFYGDNITVVNEIMEGDTTITRIVNDAFFHTNADYLFNEPEEIKVSEHNKKSIITKKVLYRMQEPEKPDLKYTAPEDMR
jgi:hypothetical protein